jgi:hypothetical protein
MSLIRLGLAASLVLALTACGGGGLGSILGPIAASECTTGTQVELAGPQAGQTVNGSNLGQVTIVANGNNNNLYNTYGQWNLRLTDQFGNTVQGGNLSLVSDPNGPHPFSSDFYYASNVGSLPSGSTWQASLQQNSGTFCNAAPLPGSFNT